MQRAGPSFQTWCKNPVLEIWSGHCWFRTWNSSDLAEHIHQLTDFPAHRCQLNSPRHSRKKKPISSHLKDVNRFHQSLDFIKLVFSSAVFHSFIFTIATRKIFARSHYINSIPNKDTSCVRKLTMPSFSCGKRCFVLSLTMAAVRSAPCHAFCPSSPTMASLHTAWCSRVSS